MQPVRKNIKQEKCEIGSMGEGYIDRISSDGQYI